MTKREFLKELEDRLQMLDEKERKDMIEEYSQHISMCMKSGMKEEEAIENIELKTSKSVPKDKIQIKVRYDADNVKDIHIDKNLYNDDEYIGDDIYIDDEYDENSMDNVALENMTQTDESESAQKNPTSQEFFISAVGRMSDIEYVLSYKDEILKNIKERKIYNYVYPQIISVEITVNPENKNLMKI